MFRLMESGSDASDAFPSRLRLGASTEVARSTAVPVEGVLANSERRLALFRALFPNARAEDVSRLLALLPKDIPPGVDVSANMAEAATMSHVEFYNAVRNRGKWDYKQLDPKYQEFGNWHFKVVANAAGYSDSFARRSAGLAQRLAGTSRPEFGLPWGGWPFGDDFRDQLEMTKADVADAARQLDVGENTSRWRLIPDLRKRLWEPTFDVDIPTHAERETPKVDRERHVPEPLEESPTVIGGPLP